jgi:hypothetical protein
MKQLKCRNPLLRNNGTSDNSKNYLMSLFEDILQQWFWLVLVQEWPKTRQWTGIVLVQQRPTWRGVNNVFGMFVYTKEYALLIMLRSIIDFIMS